MIKTRVLRVAELGPDLLARWISCQRANCALHSPFFRPEFARLAVLDGPPPEVAVAEAGDEPVAFLPFVRGPYGVGWPVGGVLNDFQGLIALAGAEVDAAQLVHQADLHAWHFHHALAAQRAFAPYHYCAAPSMYLDLRQGFAAFRKQRAQASQQLCKAEQKWRKWRRERADVEFVAESTDRRVFETLMQWKIAQYARTGSINYLRSLATRSFLWDLVRRRAPELCGVMSAIYCEGRLAAIHLGLRSCEVLHAWFPAYNMDFADYSPGMALFMKLAEAAPALGVTRIDLGRGSEQFKHGLGSGEVLVAEGSVDTRGLAGTLRRGSFWFVRWLRGTWLGRPVRAVANLFPALRRWATFH